MVDAAWWVLHTHACSHLGALHICVHACCICVHAVIWVRCTYACMRPSGCDAHTHAWVLHVRACSHLGAMHIRMHACCICVHAAIWVRGAGLLCLCLRMHVCTHIDVVPSRMPGRGDGCNAEDTLNLCVAPCWSHPPTYPPTHRARLLAVVWFWSHVWPPWTHHMHVCPPWTHHMHVCPP